MTWSIHFLFFQVRPLKLSVNCRSFQTLNLAKQWWKSYPKICTRPLASDVAYILPSRYRYNYAQKSSQYYLTIILLSSDPARKRKQWNRGNHRLGYRRQKFARLSWYIRRKRRHLWSWRTRHYYRIWVRKKNLFFIHFKSAPNLLISMCA